MLRDHSSVSIVSDLIQHASRSWRQDLFSTLYASDVTQTILYMPISITSVQDRIVWHVSKDGDYNVKDSYHHLLSETLGEVSTRGPPLLRSKVWKVLWRLKISMRIIVFIWRFLFSGSSHQRDVKFLSFVCILLHSIWYLRNKRVMEGKPSVPADCLSQAYRVWDRINQTNLLSAPSSACASIMAPVDTSNSLVLNTVSSLSAGLWDWIIVCQVRSSKHAHHSTRFSIVSVMIFWKQSLVARFDSQAKSPDRLFPSFLWVIRKGIQVVDQLGGANSCCHLFVPHLEIKQLLLSNFSRSRNYQVVGQDICNLISTFQVFKVSVVLPFLPGSVVQRCLMTPLEFGLGTIL
ncbi:ribonuclease H [Senna tora]|uniref:Ribonuclease H n=1 Tax=Senna tora TaxID=362788 RepID=A0A834SYV7_9FABA|nr:ribonuclease H [Senna tora]